MVFIEYDVDNAPNGRLYRWWAAFNGTLATLPLVMLDSGNAISYGSVSYYNTYKAMVNTALGRQAQAEIQAYWQRAGDRARIYAQVKNLSGVTLSTGNSAAIHVIVYEDAHIKLTDRYGWTAVESSIASLAQGATGTYLLETPDLTGVDWEQLHFIVLVDYLPMGSTGAYDMLQAAEALPAATLFDARPGSYTFLVEPEDLTIPALFVTFQGAGFASWEADTSTPWVDVAPGSGPLNETAVVSAVKGSLASGWQQGSVTFSTPDGLLSDTVSLRAYLGPLKRTYLPLTRR